MKQLLGIFKVEPAPYIEVTTSAQSRSDMYSSIQHQLLVGGLLTELLMQKRCRSHVFIRDQCLVPVVEVVELARAVYSAPTSGVEVHDGLWLRTAWWNRRDSPCLIPMVFDCLTRLG